jgi:hypothetical protein
MIAMINGYPTEEELRNRITRQLDWHDSSDTVALLWRGYLAGLIEWGLIEVHVHERLCKLLPKIGVKELDELSADEPLSPEREREIDEYLAQYNKEKSVPSSDGS